VNDPDPDPASGFGVGVVPGDPHEARDRGRIV